MKKKVILLLFGTLLSLLILEGFLRLFNPLGFRLKGNKIILPVKENRVLENQPGKKLDKFVKYTRNSLGFRGEDPPDKFSDYLTIITVGGSTTESIVLSDNQTWIANLGEKLSNNFSKLWINNAGLDGHSTYGHIILLKDYIASIKPKVVLFLIGANEIGIKSPNIYDKERFIPRNLDDLKNKIIYTAENLETASLILNLYRHYQARAVNPLGRQEIDFAKLTKVGSIPLVNIYDKEVDYKVLGASEISESEISNILNYHNKNFIPGYIHRLKNIISLSRNNGIEPIFITQPAVYGDIIDPETGIDLSSILVKKENGQWQTGKLSWKILELYNQVVRDIGKNENVLVIDLARMMPKSTKYYYDFIHFGKDGSKKVAEIIYHELCPYFSNKYNEFQNKLCFQKESLTQSLP